MESLTQSSLDGVVSEECSAVQCYIWPTKILKCTQANENATVVVICSAVVVLWID